MHKDGHCMLQCCFLPTAESGSGLQTQPVLNIPAQHSTDRSHIPFMSPHSTSRPMIENTDLQLVVTCHARPKHRLMSPEDRKIEWLIGRPSVPLTASADRMVWYLHPQVTSSLISSCRFCSWLKRFGFCPALHGHAVCDSWHRTGLNECLMHIH